MSSFRIFISSCLVLAICIAGYSFAVKKTPHTNPDDFSFIQWEGWGDTNGVLTGRVIDKFGDPLAYARIKVHSKDIVTRADKNGYFTLRGLQRGGHYSLIINAKGYETDVARWIPIPVNSTADIGDYHLNEEELWTNIWVLITNALQNGSVAISSNMLEIAGANTTVYTYVQWQQLTGDITLTPEGIIPMPIDSATNSVITTAPSSISSDTATNRIVTTPEEPPSNTAPKEKAK